MVIWDGLSQARRTWGAYGPLEVRTKSHSCDVHGQMHPGVLRVFCVFLATGSQEPTCVHNGYQYVHVREPYGSVRLPYEPVEPPYGLWNTRTQTDCNQPWLPGVRTDFTDCTESMRARIYTGPTDMRSLKGPSLAALRAPVRLYMYTGFLRAQNRKKPVFESCTYSTFSHGIYDARTGRSTRHATGSNGKFS